MHLSFQVDNSNCSGNQAVYNTRQTMKGYYKKGFISYTSNLNKRESFGNVILAVELL